MSTSLIQRVDTGALEVAQVGIEYYSREQHGGIFGTIYRQYFDLNSFIGPAITSNVTKEDLGISGVSRCFAAYGWYDNSSGTVTKRRYEMPRNYTGGMLTTAACVPYVDAASTTGDLCLAVGNRVIRTVFCVDYIKQVDPGPHVITHIPLDPMVRADNGLIDSPPLDGVEYIGNDQFGDFFGSIFREYFDMSGTLSSSTIIKSDVYAPIRIGGFNRRAPGGSSIMNPLQSAGGSAYCFTNYRTVPLNDLTLRSISSLADFRYDFWVDFIK